MNDEIPQLRASVAKAAIVSVVACVLLTAVAYAAARGTGKPQLAHDFAMAGGVLILAGVPGLVLSVVLTGKVRGGASIGFVAGIGVRLPVGGVVALYGLNWGLAQTISFPQVIAFAYLAFLAIEVVFLSPAVKRTAAAEAKKNPEQRSPKQTITTGDEESV